MIILISGSTATFWCRNGYVQHKIILNTSETLLIFGANCRERSLLPSSSLSFCCYVSPLLPMDVFMWHLILWPVMNVRRGIWLKSGKNVCHFSWLSEYVLLLPLTLYAIKAISSSEMVSGWWDGRRGVDIMRARHSVTLHVQCLSSLSLGQSKVHFRSGVYINRRT